ncbi:MAG: 3-deoxy-manno-octulosonate cytidylyltransferase [Coxiellaceae bacterium]|nr:3-deoxy-manno-octulosonate cytidylyltransferase [Coxiellaceae bacterium]
MEFRVIIPARYESERLPGKPLLDIAGKPMIQHVYERAVDSGADSVVIATDDSRIAEAAKGFGAPIIMTDSEHKTGTDRIAEACNALEYDDDDIVVGVQCDEPLIPPETIKQLAEDLYEHDNVKVASICEHLESVDELFNPNVVKVILNHRNYALYFSRAPIPWERGTFDKKDTANVQLDAHFRHVGLYAYRVRFLSDYTEWSDAPIENLERLEQLRILWHGARIHMLVSKKRLPVGVDTEEDLARVREQLTK